jgi:hypothetical protein
MRTLNLNNESEKAQALAIINSLVGETEFVLRTEVKLRAPKRNASFMASKGIEKIFKSKETYRKGIFGRRYETAVNTNKMLEGQEMDFVAESPRGKEFVDGSAVLLRGNTDNTRGTNYLCFQVVGDTSNEDVYTDQTGKVWPKADIEQILPTVYENKSQGTEAKILWNTPKLESLQKIKINGQVIKLIHG